MVGDPKTRRGHRTLPLDAHVVQLLAAERKRQGAIAGYAVLDAFGRPLRPERYSDLWRDMLRGAEVRDLDLRAARRSAVTAMRDAGVADHITARWTGHDESVMRRHYSVAHDEPMKSAADAMARALGTSL